MLYYANKLICSHGAGDACMQQQQQQKKHQQKKLGQRNNLNATKATNALISVPLSQAHTHILIFQCCAPLFFPFRSLPQRHIYVPWLLDKTHTMSYLHYITCALYTNWLLDPALKIIRMMKFLVKVLQSNVKS